MSKISKDEFEDQWFLEHEKELLEAARRERERRKNQREAEASQKKLDELRSAHWLKCPKCGHDMETKQVEGVELDECSFCEGVYFDRGELDAFLMRKTDQRFSFFRSIFGLD